MELILKMMRCFFGYITLVKVASKALHHDCTFPSKDVKTVELCYTAHDVNCSSYPSPPRNLNLSYSFNKICKNANLRLSWNPPVYGESTLWGYEVILSYDHSPMEKCYRINGKNAEHRNFTFKNVQLGRVFHIMVTAIPYLRRNMINSIHKSIQLPDKCSCLKDAHMDFPFACKQVKEVKLEETCNNHGKSVIVWKVPDADHKEIHGQIISKCPRSKKILKLEFKLKKNATMKVFEDLEMGCEYYVKLMMVKIYKGEWRTSKPSSIRFNCSKTTKDVKKAEIERLLSIHDKALYSGLGILAIAISIACIVYHQKRNSVMIRCFKENKYVKKSSVLLANANENMEKKEASSVMLLHSGGCEALHDLVLIFASILNANGLRVRLDLLERSCMEEIGAATYYEKAESESDFVIILCTDVAVTDTPQAKAFNFILEMIKQNIMDGRDRTKYIPVYFESSSLVPGTLRCVSRKLPDAMVSILQKLHRIDAYVLLGNLPIKNNVSLKNGSFQSLKICIEELSKKSHSRCSFSTCSKGTVSSLYTKDLTNSFEDLI